MLWKGRTRDKETAAVIHISTPEKGSEGMKGFPYGRKNLIRP